MQDFMANLHQLELDERHCVKFPLLAHHISDESPFKKKENYPYGFIPPQRVQVFPVRVNSAKNETSEGTVNLLTFFGNE